MALHVSVSVNDREIIKASAVNTGMKQPSGETVYDFFVWSGSNPQDEGHILHKREDGAAVLAQKMLERVPEEMARGA